MDYLQLFVLIVVFFGGVLAKWWFDRAVHSQAIVVSNAKAGIMGRAAQKEQEEDLQALISEASMALKEAKDKGENIQDTAKRVIPGLMAKYPKVIAKHGKKLLKMVSKSGELDFMEEFL